MTATTQVSQRNRELHFLLSFQPSTVVVSDFERTASGFTCRCRRTREVAGLHLSRAYARMLRPIPLNIFYSALRDIKVCGLQRTQSELSLRVPIGTDPGSKIAKRSL